MRIYIDADACPRPVRDVLYKLIDRFSIDLVFVANRTIPLPRSKYISLLQVAHGFDEADNQIVRLIKPNDLLITSDIPLASDAIAKGAVVINSRGKIYSQDNIRQELAVRDLLSHLRDNQQISGGSSSYSNIDKSNFANAIDRILTKAKLNKLI